MNSHHGEKMRHLLDHMGGGLLMLDDQFRHVLWSRAYEALFNFPEGFLKPGLKFIDALLWFYQEEGYSRREAGRIIKQHSVKFEKAKTDKKIIQQVDMADGRVIDVTVDFSSDGAIIFNFLDVTNREKANADALFHMGQRESLTGYPNRFLLKSYLKKVLNRAKGEGLSFRLVQLNIDNFQFINEAYGISAGDLLITTMAQRLSGLIHEQEFLAHLGGDAFAIVGGFNFDNKEMLRHVRELQRKISEPLTIFNGGQHVELMVEMSAGVTQYPNDNSSVDELFLNADIALNIAKKENRGGVVFYDPAMQSEIKDRKFLVTSLRESLATSQLILHYQPQIDLKTRQVSGAEALLRWQHPDRGWISPGEFIPLAELTKLIIPLTEQLLPQACKEARFWQDQGVRPFPVAVNISPLHFLHESFVPLVKKSLEVAQLAPNWLEIEITEGILMNRAEETIAKLEELADMGVSLAIDDFGTGYSSLTYLRTLPVNKLKIDQAFITDLVEEGDSRSVIEAIIKLGHSFNLKITAEGVEDPAVLDLLTEMNCDNAQGYFISHPLAGDQLVEWVREYYRKDDLS